MKSDVLCQVTVENISQRLRPYESARLSPTWNQIMQSEGVQRGFGELRDPVDWRSLPMDKLLRIVYLKDELGPVIRWLLTEDPGAQRLLGGINHDHLERGDGHGEARSGWLKTLKDGVRVTP